MASFHMVFGLQFMVWGWARLSELFGFKGSGIKGLPLGAKGWGSLFRLGFSPSITQYPKVPRQNECEQH